MNTAASALTEIDQIVEEGGDADDILRAVVGVLVESGGCSWAGILFAEQDELALGPEAGTQEPSTRTQVAVVFQGSRVAELAADGCEDRGLLESVAQVISPYCLVGWDTGGVPWDDTA